MPNLILVDKPASMTSFKVVSAIKRLTGIKRVGHTGTLDPMATGVLPIFTGRASRLSRFMLEENKRYEATVRLGTATDTGDITGETISTRDVNIDDVQLKDALFHFVGDIEQIPPMYSALKKDGVRLYELARKGIEVDRAPRNVTVFSIDLVKRLDNTDFIMDVSCSKGTYIRTLAEDIGEYLGTGATLTALRRTEVSGFTVSDCVPLEEIEKNGAETYLLDPQLAVIHLRECNVSKKQAARFLCGGQLDIARIPDGDTFFDGEFLRVRSDAEFLGIGEADLKNNRINISCIIKE